MMKIMHQAALAAALTLAATAPTQAAEVNLRFAHFFPSVSAQHKEIFKVWADEVEQASQGRIKVEIYPGATLSKPPAQYDAVINRIADMTATIPGYTANRFPLTQIVELPGVVKDAVQGSCVVQSLYQEGLLDSEYKDTHPLFLFTHGQGHLHMKSKEIREPSDLANLRIRRPTAVVAKLLEGLNAVPVGMPAPDTYQSLQRGVIDGVTLPWEGAKVFRLNDLSETHTEVGGLYSLAFTVTMNKAVYNGLPDDLKKVIDEHSGMTWAKRAGEVFNQLDADGRADAVKAGQTIITIEGGAENPAWKPVMDKATEDYLQELEAKGLPARQVYERTKQLAQQCQ